MVEEKDTNDTLKINNNKFSNIKHLDIMQLKNQRKYRPLKYFKRKNKQDH